MKIDVCDESKKKTSLTINLKTSILSIISNIYSLIRYDLKPECFFLNFLNKTKRHTLVCLIRWISEAVKFIMLHRNEILTKFVIDLYKYLNINIKTNELQNPQPNYLAVAHELIEINSGFWKTILRMLYIHFINKKQLLIKKTCVFSYRLASTYLWNNSSKWYLSYVLKTSQRINFRCFHSAKNLRQRIVRVLKQCFPIWNHLQCIRNDLRWTGC